MKAKFQDLLKQALKAKDKLRLETIRSVLSAIQYEEMQQAQDVLPDTTIIGIVKNELKKRKESLEFSKQAGRLEEVTKLENEIKILEEFLPKQLSESELENVILSFKAEGITNLGDLMKKLKTAHAGNYDGKLASEIAKKLIG